MHTQHNLERIKEIVSSREMESFEKEQFLRSDSYFFMKKAGNEVFKAISKNFSNKQPVIVLCGPGNNGGDGFVIAKNLDKKGYQVEVYALINKNNYKGDALKAFSEYGNDLKII